MARDPDEDALSWGDERDATHAAELPEEQHAQVRVPADDLDRALGDVDAAAQRDDRGTTDGAAGQLGSAALVFLGVIGGVYLLYALGWLGIVLRDGTPYGDEQPVQRIFYQLGQVLAVAAAPLWFGTTISLTRPAIIRRGLPWLVAGLILLAPWPFLLAV